MIFGITSLGVMVEISEMVARMVPEILEYDSGQSSFYMIAKPFPLMTVKTAGSSHYFGDIYKDLDGGWIQKASMHEWVISETNVPGQSKPIHNVIERTLRLTNLGY